MLSTQTTRGYYGLSIGFFLAAVFLFLPARQSDTPPPPITAENVAELGSVLHLDFAEVTARNLTPGSGLFVMNADASVIVTFANAEGESPLSTAVIWNGETGDLETTLAIGENAYDRALSPDGTRLIVGTGEGATIFTLTDGTSQAVLPIAGGLVAVWFDEAGRACGEANPTAEAINGLVICEGADPVPLFPDADDLYARIGRVLPPLAITSSEDGRVTRWDIAAGEATAQAQADVPVVFGAVNVAEWPSQAGSGSHLAWRDELSTRLSLLDFATGENTFITELDGSFISYLLLSRDADVIFAVDPMSQRRAVWAWLAESGERLDLGQYRDCGERQQPDLAELSPDGATLVIGCAAGLDIWRSVGQTD